MASGRVERCNGMYRANLPSHLEEQGWSGPSSLDSWRPCSSVALWYFWRCSTDRPARMESPSMLTGLSRSLWPRSSAGLCVLAVWAASLSPPLNTPDFWSARLPFPSSAGGGDSATFLFLGLLAAAPVGIALLWWVVVVGGWAGARVEGKRRR